MHLGEEGSLFQEVEHLGGGVGRAVVKRQRDCRGVKTRGAHRVRAGEDAGAAVHRAALARFIVRVSA